MSTSAPKRTIFCPTGCHEDYLERESIPETKDDKFYGSLYPCYRCGWVARWDNHDGFEVLIDVGEDSPNVFSDDEQMWEEGELRLPCIFSSPFQSVLTVSTKEVIILTS